ncbi:MAG: hypothetical protein AAFU60_15435 [Bacteroidota bacterium]
MESKDYSIEVVKIKLSQSLQKSDAKDLILELPSLEELTPQDVFARRCAQLQVPEEQQADLLDQFATLQNWMQEKDDQ